MHRHELPLVDIFCHPIRKVKMRLSHFLTTSSVLALSLTFLFKATIASNCTTETVTLNQNSEVTAAATAFDVYAKSVCSSGDTSVCNVNLLPLEISIDFTKMYTDSSYTALKSACVNAGGQICYVTVSVSAVAVSMDIQGYPSCFGQSCNATTISEDNMNVGGLASILSFIGVDISLPNAEVSCGSGR